MRRMRRRNQVLGCTEMGLLLPRKQGSMEAIAAGDTKR